MHCGQANLQVIISTVSGTSLVYSVCRTTSVFSRLLPPFRPSCGCRPDFGRMQYANDFKKLSLEARLLWLIVGLGAVSVSAIALIASFSFSGSSVITLLIGCVIAALTCQHRAVIPFTDIRLSTKAIFVF